MTLVVGRPVDTALTVCPHCAEFVGGQAFAIDGVSHTAPESWIVGSRQAHEAAGVMPMQATWLACRAWAEHCAEIEARS